MLNGVMHPNLGAIYVMLGNVVRRNVPPNEPQNLPALLRRRRADAHAQTQRSEQQILGQIVSFRLADHLEELQGSGGDKTGLERRHDGV